MLEIQLNHHKGPQGETKRETQTQNNFKEIKNDHKETQQDLKEMQTNHENMGNNYKKTPNYFKIRTLTSETQKVSQNGHKEIRDAY